VESFHIYFALTADTRCGKESNPLKLFAVFSATAWNFCVKFYTFM